MTRRELLGSMTAAAASAGPAGDGWTTLFNGRSLDGWSIQQGPESAFHAAGDTIAGTASSGYPAWLRSAKQYENFEAEFEWFVSGWNDGGFYFCAPEHGVPSRCGFKLSLFHQVDKTPVANSSGSIYPVVAPKSVNVRDNDWNRVRVKLDWPSLQAWSNGELIHDIDIERNAELKYRLRSGYIGFETLSYPIRFRNIRIRPLAGKLQWDSLYETPGDLDKWTLTELHQTFPARFDALGSVLRSDGLGNLTTREKYRDFALQLYIRGIKHHNGGVLFRSLGGRERYEIQLHDVEEAHFPTGSLYYHERARYPKIEPEGWFLFQLFVRDRWCLVRINGETVMEYQKLQNLEPGFIELQAHQNGRWMEYKQIRIRRLS
jgi:hypothetical protein